MSCFPEQAYAIYVDGELSPEETRPLESHLIGCQACRALVVALREEIATLGDVLHERPGRPVRVAARPAAPARGLALGLGPTLAVVGVVAVVIGGLLEAGLPASIGWLNPVSVRGAYSMMFDLVFLLRDEAPGLLELAVALAALASVSAVLTFVATAVLRRYSGPGALSLQLLLCLVPVVVPQDSSAHFGLHNHEAFSLAAGETHDGTLIASGDSVNIDGIVEGDLIVMARRVAVRGEVRGSVYAVAGNLEISGVINGSLLTASERANVSGSVAHNLYAFVEHLTLAGSGRIDGDASLLADGAVVEGAVGRDLFIWGEWIEIRGAIGRNVQAMDVRLALLDGARIGGNVSAALREGEEIEVAPGAQVSGEIRTTPHQVHTRPGFARFLDGSFYLWAAIHLAAAFLVGMILHTLLPGLFACRLETTSEFFRSLGIGFVALIATPVALCVLAATLAGIPLALIGAWLYVTALYVSAILVAALIGSALVRTRTEGPGSFGLTLVTGLGVLLFAVSIPFVGILLGLIVVLTGLGALAQQAVASWRSVRRAAA